MLFESLIILVEKYQAGLWSFLFFSIMLMFYYLSLKESIASLSWPETDGVITKSKTVKRPSLSELGYIIKYKYLVGRETYTSHQVEFVDRNGVAEKYTEMFPKGAVVKVFYNPKNPKKSILLKGENKKIKKEIKVGVVLGLIITSALFIYGALSSLE